jgi:hypothetical protein
VLRPILFVVAVGVVLVVTLAAWGTSEPPVPPGVPKGFVPAGGCVPAMGQHWISPKA